MHPAATILLPRMNLNSFARGPSDHHDATWKTGNESDFQVLDVRTNGLLDLYGLTGFREFATKWGSERNMTGLACIDITLLP